MLTSFPPVISAGVNTLILGSMPGSRSLQEQQYYAHPRNLFWPFISELLKLPPDMSYEQRLTQLLAHGIGLWDVLQHCQRPGSLDSSIKNDSMVANDFESLLKQYPSIRRIFFNGKKAQDVFNRLVLNKIKIEQQITLSTLPSTSPANASMTRDFKLQCWSEVINR